MANISSSNSQGVRVPKLRFPGFEGEWEVHKLSDITSFIRTRNQASKRQFISTENMKQNCSGIEPYIDDDIVDGIAFEVGDILIANIRPYLKKAWLASFSGICSADVLTIHPINISSAFLYSAISRDCFFTYVMSGVKGSKMPRGDKNHIMDFRLAIPSIKEQEKIAEFVQKVNERIEKQRQLVETLKSYKRGVSTALLTRKLRLDKSYTSHTNEWNKKYLGDIFSERIEKATGNERLLAVTISSGVQDRTNLDLKDNSSDDKKNYRVVHIGDLAYNTMRMWQGACGVSEFDGIVSPAYTVLYVTDSSENFAPFWGYYFKETFMLQTFQRNSQGLTSDTWNLKYEKFAHISVYAPPFQEQLQIAGFLDRISDKIVANEDILNTLVKYKRGLLSLLFI